MKCDEINVQNNRSLSAQFGPLIGGKDLFRVLGFRTPAAFRRALRLNRLGVVTFAIEGRRGQFALSADVEKWLNSLKKAKAD